MNSVCKSCLTALLICLIAGCGAKKDNSKKEAVTPENQVEQAVFTTFEGDSVRVADYKGKVVLIDFWETWCKPCIASFSTLETLEKEYPEDFVVLAVTPGFTDTKDDARGFAKKHDYTFQYLIDSMGLSQKLGIQSIPYKIFVGPDGKYIKSSLGSYGPDQDYKKIKKIIEKHKMKASSSVSEET